MTTDPYGQYASPYVGMGNNPILMADADGGWADGDGDPVYAGGYLNKLDEVVVNGRRMTPGERYAARYDRGLRGDNLFAYDNGGMDVASRNWFNSMRDYRERMNQARDPALDLINVASFLTGAGDVYIIGRSVIQVGAKLTITAAAKYALSQAAKNPVNTLRELNLAANVPQLEAAMLGKGIDRSFRYYAGKNFVLRPANKLGLIKLNPTNRGADMIGGKLLNGKWWDVTTRNSWSTHVAKYGDGGIGLFYK